MIQVQNHTFSIAQKLQTELCGLKHSNGNPVIEAYSHSSFTDPSKQGPIVTFNVKRSDGSYVGFNHVLHLASSCNIHLRGGCFCNVGACMSMMKISSHILKTAYQSGHTCGGGLDSWDGQPLGAVRASLGYMSIEKDVAALLQFLKDCFLETEIEQEVFYDSLSQPSQLHLKEIYVYPVKSCRGMKVSEWPLCTTGLKYDRSWMIVDEHGAGITLKREHKLAFIQPHIDLDEESLTLKADGAEPITIPINIESSYESTSVDVCHTKVCGDRVVANDCGDEASQWLSGVLGKATRLVYKASDSQRTKSRQNVASTTKSPALALTNQAQYLLLSFESAAYLREAMVKNNKDAIDVESVISRFRCNLLVAGAEPFEEERWSEMVMQSDKGTKDIRFQCTGLCNRCSMICVDSLTGEKDIEPLRTMGTLPVPNDPKSRRRTSFGAYLKSTSANSSISVGNSLVAKFASTK